MGKNEELQETLYWGLPKRKFKQAQKIIDEGADINLRTENGRTMLHDACIDVDMKLLKFLLENKIDVNILDYGENPALYYLLNRGINNHVVKMINHLLKSGADAEKFASDPLVKTAQELIAVQKQTEKNFNEALSTLEKDSYLGRLDNPVLDLIAKCITNDS